jgi:hypothetical protein
MPLTQPQSVLPADTLSDGRNKINSNFEFVKLFVDYLESSITSIVPEDVGNLIVDGKINPQFLEEFLVSVTADDVTVSDVANVFSGTTVESVLYELYGLAQNATPGSKWIAQAGVPASGLGNVTDFYLNTTAGDVYEKTGVSTWTLRFNIKGEAGAPGAGTGDVTGPASSVSGRFASFNGTTGKIIQDSTFSSSSFATAAQGTLATNAVPNTRTVSGANSVAVVGGGTGVLSSNVQLQLSGDASNPGNNKVYGTNASGVRGWKNDPSGGSGDVVGPASAVNERIAVFDGTTGKLIKDGGVAVAGLATAAQGTLAGTAVQPARSILTEHSLRNGGDLSANRTLSLVGDVANPGNNQVYGTNGSGARTWKPDPAGGGSTATTASVSTSRALTNADHNKILLCTNSITLTLPAGLQADLQTIVLNIGTGIVTFATSGGAAASPTGVTLNNTVGVSLTAATVLHNLSNNTYYVISSGDVLFQSSSVSASRSLTNADHNRILLCTNTISLTLPSTLRNDFRCTVINIGSGNVTFVAGASTTLTPSGVVLYSSLGVNSANLLHTSSGAWYLDTPQIPDTVTTIYSGSWVGSRPVAVHVLAVGHTTAPSWLTAADVWLQAV